jgi:hypothetical protein
VVSISHWLRTLRERRERRQARREAKRTRHLEKVVAQQAALRGRDEHTGGYGDPPY